MNIVLRLFLVNLGWENKIFHIISSIISSSFEYLFLCSQPTTSLYKKNVMVGVGLKNGKQKILCVPLVSRQSNHMGTIYYFLHPIPSTLQPNPPSTCCNSGKKQENNNIENNTKSVMFGSMGVVV
jgi:hypothetical protein